MRMAIPQKGNREIRFWLPPKTIRRIGELVERDNLKGRREFLERALAAYQLMYERAEKAS